MVRLSSGFMMSSRIWNQEIIRTWRPKSSWNSLDLIPFPAFREVFVAQKRNRLRPASSLQQRLRATADLARKRAQALPPGEERDGLVRKADSIERSAALEAWLATPGQEPPE
jgi:hypothetical protein